MNMRDIDDIVISYDIKDADEHCITITAVDKDGFGHIIKTLHQNSGAVSIKKALATNQ
jgi:hypothetical protein